MTDAADQPSLDDITARLHDYKGAICRLVAQPEGWIVAEAWDAATRVWRQIVNPGLSEIMHAPYAGRAALDRAGVPQVDRGWNGMQGAAAEDQESMAMVGIALFRDRAPLSMPFEALPASFTLRDEHFVVTAPPDWLELFYDWLRGDGGVVIGVTVAVETLTEQERARLLPLWGVAIGGFGGRPDLETWQYLTLFVGDARDFDQESSVDADLGDYHLFHGDRGSIVITFSAPTCATTKEWRARHRQATLRIKDLDGLICRVRDDPSHAVERWDQTERRWCHCQKPEYPEVARAFYASEQALDRAGVPVVDRESWRGDPGATAQEAGNQTLQAIAVAFPEPPALWQEARAQDAPAPEALSREAALRVLTPHDCDGMIERLVEQVSGRALEIKSWDPESRRWWLSHRCHTDIARAPYATHRAMDFQRVPLADRTRFNPPGDEDALSSPRFWNDSIVRIVAPPRDGPAELQQWDAMIGQWGRYNKRSLWRLPPLATAAQLKKHRVRPTEPATGRIRRWWDRWRR